jgi:integrase
MKRTTRAKSTVGHARVRSSRNLTGWRGWNKGEEKKERSVTLRGLYGLWQPTHNRTKDTMNCYAAGMNYFKTLWDSCIVDIDIDDLQDCIDDCPKGKRTRENMKTIMCLLYGYGIPRGLIPSGLNLGKYLKSGGGDSGHKSAFTDEEVAKIKDSIGKVKYAGYIYSIIYLGFRPSEFLALDAINYNRKEKAFVGGAKTEAGTDRTVTVSPKIQSIIDGLTKDKISGPVFCGEKGKAMSIKDFRAAFYAVLEELKIDNPTATVNEAQVHRLTPHSCRHTFATLMKKVTANDKDKLALIGHASDEMLRYYQDVNFDDLRRITNAI